MDAQKRREQNRMSARRHYHKTLQKLQALRRQQDKLEQQYELCKTRLDPSNSKVGLLDELTRTRNALVKENREMNKRRNEFLLWEYRLKTMYGNELQIRRPIPSTSTPDGALVMVERASGSRPSLGAYLKTPLTTEDCNEITSKVYVEIQQFTHSEQFASTGSSVFGWSDRRRVENGLIKFSLEKQFNYASVDAVTFKTWTLNRSPAAREQMLSQYMNSKCDLVQEVDFNNVVVYQELQVRKRVPTSNGGERELLIVVRSLILISLLETANGYLMIYYSLDPNLLERAPDSTAATAPAGVTVRYEWVPTFRWCTAERAGENGEHCVCTYVGSVPVQEAGDIRWAVEVLQYMVRWENHVIGPMMTLSHSDSNSEQDQAATAQDGLSHFDWW